MALFKPNLTCVLRKSSGTDVYGREILGQPLTIGCSIISLKLKAVDSSVRADSSATRGAAKEFIGDGRLLLPADTNVAIDDQIEVAGFKTRIVSKFPRHGLKGKLDHYEVEVGIWSKE